VPTTTRMLHFGTDGIRGHADDELSDESVRALGRATARVLGRDRLFLLARDTRESGARIEAALAAGLADEGGQVESVGVFPTPGLAYLSQTRGLPAAMISASHNSFHDNGIKVFASGGRKLADAVEADIEREMGGLPPSPGGARPSLVPSDADREGYLEHLVGALEGRTLDGVRVVIDCANGAAFEVAPQVLTRLGADVEVRCADPDGRNINAGCGSTHPEGLQRAVVKAGAHAGLAFDGDADRLIAVDEKGALLDGDHFLAIAAADLRSRNRLRGDAVVTTVMANLGFRKAMDAEGIAVVETRVGDRYVLEEMDAGDYALGGEQSGHVIFADLATTGDGILSGLVLLDAMRRAQRPLSEMAAMVQKLPQVLRNVEVVDRTRLDAATGFWDEVAAVEAEMGSGGRVLVRPSGTEPLVRVMVEAPTHDEAERHAGRLISALVAALGSPSPA